MAKKKQAPALKLTDTTFRDGNQSLLGGHMLPDEILPIAERMDGIGFHSVEAFGGATFETFLRLGADPWDYLRGLHKALPKTPIQALIRGQNLVGTRNFADDTVELFVRHAANCGVDVFRVFDPLNDLRNMEAAIRAAKTAGKRVQGALSYAISPAHTLQLWCSLAKGLAEMGSDEVVVKDTSGLLSPQVTWELVTALREAVSVPIVVHSHCTSGMAPMSYMAAIEAGANVVDTAMSPLAWGASQPGCESVVAALAGGDYDTGLNMDRLAEVTDLLEPVKRRHVEHMSSFVDRVDSDVLRYQMPGFMLEDIQRQLEQHNAADRFDQVLKEVTRVRSDLGDPPLVAPVRQLIASQAVFNILGKERYETVTQELKDYLQGLYGRPPKPADPDIRRLVLGREEPITIRNYLLFPALTLKLLRPPPREEKPKDKAPAPNGSEPAAAAPPPPPAEQAPPAPAAAEFEVEVEGEIFKVRVSGAGMAVAPMAGAAPAPAATAAPSKDGAVVAPMQGLIVKLPVKKGDPVKLGDVVAVLEAMKMQNDIVSTMAGSVVDVYVKEGDVVTPNQAILAIA
ncbi:MAG: pyruvate carboxylase subunit B [Chloroflexi bacterium]|nr:MAG: pyruvate carboxylase subunit B [Chloroflexota bacterium]